MKNLKFKGHLHSEIYKRIMVTGALCHTFWIKKSAEFARQDYFDVTVKPLYNDHLYNQICYLWFIQ